MGKAKLTKKIVNERISDRGIELISEYATTLTKSTFVCSHGHQWEAKPADVMSGRGCPHCSNRFPLTKSAINSRISDRGIEMVGEFTTTGAKSTFVCSHGHQWEAKPSNVMGKTGCPHCSDKKPLTKEEVNSRISDRGIEMVGEFTTTLTKSTFVCSHGHQWEVEPNSLFKGSGCPECRVEDMRVDVIGGLNDRGIHMVDEFIGMTSKVRFECEHGHRWVTTPTAVNRGQGCPDCAGVKPLTKAVVNKRIADRGLRLVGEYLTRAKKSTFECSCGHRWDTVVSGVLSGTGCPKCASIATDNDAIYIWQVDQSDIFKIGITSYRLGDFRIKRCANTNRQDATIVRLVPCQDARALEDMLHDLGVDPKLDVPDGRTEFRRLTDDELNLAIEMVDMAHAKS